MRHTLLLPLAAAAASAFIVPQGRLLQQFAVTEKQAKAHDTVSHDDISEWFTSIQQTVQHTVDTVAEKVRDNLGLADFDLDDSDVDVQYYLEEEEEDAEGPPGRGRPGHGHHGHHGHHSNKTLYELIQASNYTKKLAKIIDEFDGIKDLLNSTDANYTLFAPIDRAFERMPHRRRGKHGKKEEREGDEKDGDDDDDKKPHRPSKEFIEAALKYHVVPGFFPAGRVLYHHTLPSALESSVLGKPQRLRISVSVFGARVNFFSKIVARNIFGSNGVIHAIDHVLVPPPPAEKILSLLPTQFSTLTLALEKTGLGKELHDAPKHGGTLFAPSNRAWTALGPRLNAFLFSEHGKKYLKALLKYHVVLNETLYSDAFYGEKSGEASSVPESKDVEDANFPRRSSWHVDLPTLLDDKTLAVDVKRWGRFITIHVNGFSRVTVQDGIAKDGVIHVVSNVLVPPHKRHGKPGDHENDGISVEELKERLSDLVDDEEQEL